MHVERRCDHMQTNAAEGRDFHESDQLMQWSRGARPKTENGWGDQGRCVGHATNEGYALNEVDHRQQNGNQFDHCQQNENQFDCWPAIGANWCTIVSRSSFMQLTSTLIFDSGGGLGAVSVQLTVKASLALPLSPMHCSINAHVVAPGENRVSMTAQNSVVFQRMKQPQTRSGESNRNGSMQQRQ